MIVKVLVYVGLFLLIRSWIRKAFFANEIPAKPKSKTNSKDAFEASYTVVDQEK